MIALLTVLLSPFAVVPYVVAAWVAGEPAMVMTIAAQLAGFLIGASVLIRTGSLRLCAAIELWTLVAVSITAHILLGGYLWSGGYLLFAILSCVLAAMFMSLRDTAIMTAVSVTAAVALAPFEGVLRASREQPVLGYSVFIFVGLFLISIGFSVPPLLALSSRLKGEQARNRELMLNILPASIANRLKAQPGMIADRVEGCSIVFADLVGFTAHSKGKDPTKIVDELNTIFTRFDALAAQHGAEKIKTIGDGYMAATGLPDPDPDHVRHAADLALAMIDAMPALNDELGTDFRLRVGVNTGSVVAGVVGASKFSYDVWGDTVNLASRLESNGTPDLVVTSAAVAAALGGSHTAEPLGVRDLKGQGPTELYRLARPQTTTV